VCYVNSALGCTYVQQANSESHIHSVKDVHSNDEKMDTLSTEYANGYTGT